MPRTPRPLDGLPSIKWKLGAVIVAAVAVTVVVVDFGVRAGVSPILSALAAGSLSILMVQVLARGMTSPLREMASATRAMAQGDYGRRVTSTSRDEVGELARAFNAMAAELAETDRMRRDLVANVSHELRTPITALQAGLENLVDGVEPPGPEQLRTMLKQAERLGRLVTQLLDLSRLESGAIPLQRSNFKVLPVLEDAADESRLHAPHVQVSVSVDDPELAADGDPERVHQVVANLLENAIRHSPAGGRVEVRARPDRGRVAIEVLDEGPGIPEEEASRVFERFYRADTARSSSAGGAGLGLAIARWIVDLHGGDIRAERRTPTGCRMVVLLPGAAR
ncbi:MAG TPA: ATP-binding protein [Acidimicrobiia bacterium]|nr:ATP-binding protein [Acidimicrobiia bacterium]